MPSPRPRRPPSPPSSSKDQTQEQPDVTTRTPHATPKKKETSTTQRPETNTHATRRTHRVDNRKKAEQRLKRNALITTAIIVAIFYIWLALSQLIPPKAANGQVLPANLSSASTPPEPDRIPFARRRQALVELIKSCYHVVTRCCPLSNSPAAIPVTETPRRERGDITAPLASFNDHDVGPTR